ncbi:MAG: tetratricopeptide repeat protein [bacterium]
MKRIIFLIFTLSILLGCSKEPQSFDELIAAGKEAFNKENYSKARGYLTQAVKIQPSQYDALYFLGLSYSRDYMMDSALFYLKKADIYYKDDREINLELYKVAIAVQDAQTAMNAITVLIKTGDPAEYYDEQMAELNAYEGKFYNALYHYKRLLQKDPDNLNRYLDVANCAGNADSIQLALNTLDSAEAKFGRLPEIQLNRGVFLASIEKYEEAEKILRELFKSDTLSNSTRLSLAHVLASQNNIEKKKEALKHYVYLNDKFPGSFNLDSLITVLKTELNP